MGAESLPPPQPSNASDLARWTYTSLVRRILYGQWRPDATRRIAETVGTTRANAWGAPDLSANCTRLVWDSLAVLYNRAPIVGHADNPEAGARLAGELAAAGYWQLMQRVQRDTLGLREMLIRVDVTPAGALYHRPVFPDLVVAFADPDEPDTPVAILEARIRKRPETGGFIWAWDYLDISNPDNPVYRVVSSDKPDAIDLSTEFLGGDLSGAAYPYRDAENKPVLPYVLFHAAKTAQLWDCYSTTELTDGTLNVSVYSTQFGHMLRQASWPQRYGINVTIGGDVVASPGAPGEMDRRHEVTTDPATVVLFDTADPDAGQAILGQWSPASQPSEFYDAVSSYKRDAILNSGLNPADMIRMAGDPRSGYAVSVSRDMQREAARYFEPQFRRGDLAVMQLSAILLNRARNLNIPESGYTVDYAGIPLSPEEKEAQRKHVLELVGAGFMDPVDAYMTLNPGIARDAAEQALTRNREQRARFA